MYKSSKPAACGLGGVRRLGLLLAPLVMLGAQAASADPVYIQQASGAYHGAPPTAGLLRGLTQGNFPNAGSANPYELYMGSHPRNLAQSLVIGSNNLVTQIQTGKNNSSNVGILGGNYNNVAVVQGGNSLRSNVVLLNTQGMNIGVLQPNGAAAVDLLVARLPNGSLVIRP